MALRPGFHIARSGKADENDTTGFNKSWALTHESAGSSKLQMCRSFFPPGAATEVAHYHPDSQTGIYVLNGHAAVYIGEEQELFEVHPGDFIYIAANTIHAAKNLSSTEPYEAILVRDTDNEIVIEWEPGDDGDGR